MGIGRRLAGGAAALGAGTLPFLVGMPGAVAAETKTDVRELNYEFTNGNGDSVVCHILGVSSLTRPTGDPTFDSSSETRISTDSGCRASLVIEVHYTDQDGHARESSATGFDALSLQNDDVAANYVATHTITFVDCINFCTAVFDTRPK